MYVELLKEALSYRNAHFSNDAEVSGADLVDWFAGWSERVREGLILSQAVIVTEPVIYDPAKYRVYTFLVAFPDGGPLRCKFSGDTIQQVRTREPSRDFRVMPLEEALTLIEEHEAERFSKVYTITEERYQDMLEILPPFGWVGDCFSCMEATSGAWHSCFTKAPDGQYLEGMRNVAKETPTQANARMVAAWLNKETLEGKQS